MIVGRSAELGVLDGCLDGAAAGSGSALVVRGEAGIGKSAMLNHAVGRAGALGMRSIDPRVPPQVRPLVDHVPVIRDRLVDHRHTSR